MKPLKDWIICHVYEDPSTTIALPDSVKGQVKMDESHALIVDAIGEDAGWWDDGKFHQLKAKVGDIVIVEGMYVVKFTFRKNVYFAMRGKDIAFIVEPQDFEQKAEKKILTLGGK